VEVPADGERVVTDGPFAETREILGPRSAVDGHMSGVRSVSWLVSESSFR